MTTVLGPEPQDDVVFYVMWGAHQGGHPVGPFREVDELTSYMTRRRLPLPDGVVVPNGPRGGNR